MKSKKVKKVCSTNYIFPIITGTFFLLLFIVAIYQFKQESRSFSNELIIQHTEQLADIFHKIDESCGIIDFEHEKNYVDFLTVKSFISSEVGAMNLAHPEKWEGPYVKDNPTIQEKQYVIINTLHGYYVAPDDGVTLASGKIIGKDIILDKNTDFEKLIKDPQMLLFDNRPMAALVKKK